MTNDHQKLAVIVYFYRWNIVIRIWKEHVKEIFLKIIYV
jgi:hypothetical protein